jgi:hypothetical protein
MRNILFLLLSAGTYFGLHLFIYVSITRLFGVASPTARLAILVSVLALSVSFFAAAALSRVAPNAATALLYRVAATWVGLVVCLMLTFAVAWLVHLGLSRAGLDLKLWLGSLAVAVAVILTAVASLAALRPSVTDVTVPMAGLPPEWSGRTVIQLSDVHLGQVQGPRFAADLVAQVNALHPYAVFVTGDLFDGMGGDLPRLVEIMNGLAAERGVYFVTGNHEHYLGIDRVLDAMKKSNFKVLDNEVADIDGLQVVGLAFPGLQGQTYPADIITSRPGYDAARPSVLLYHEPVSVNHGRGSASRSDLYFSPDTDFSVQRDSGIDLQLSGHTHAGQFFPFDLVARAVFSGYHFGLHSEGDFSIYITSGTGTWGPPLRLGTKSEIVRLHLVPQM